MQERALPVLRFPSQEEVQKLAARATTSEKREFFINNDIAVLHNIAQRLVNQNNQQAEEALLQQDDTEASLVNYAANEQDIIDTYNYLLLRYEGVLESNIDKEQYKLSLYFDNYFVDFEYNLKEAKKQLQTKVHHHPYFMKMYRTTQDKLSTIYKIYLDNVERFKKSYVTDRNALRGVREEKKRYMVAFHSLVDEFETYSSTFLDALDAEPEDYEVFEKQKEKLQQRYSV